MPISADLIRGHTETVILARLMDGDSYGYQINKDIMELSGGSYELKEATLYTAFRRLEQAGLITAYWGNELAGARRKYYTITDDGRAAYYTALEEWKSTRSILDRLLERSGG